MHHWRQLRAVLMLPGIVTVLVPYLLLRSAVVIRLGGSLHGLSRILVIAVGALQIGIGLALLIQTVRLFATRGQGTLAPWEPPRNLVVEGVYRRVRNPMISGVFALLLGETFVFAARPLLIWFLIVVAVNVIYIPLLEEPMLLNRFGERYHIYLQHVPRWIPRLVPWTPPWDS